jgi:hypothetical protein
MAGIPRWLAPWLIPLALVVGIIAVAVSVSLGVVLLVVLLLLVVPYLRLQYLKQHPPNPELRHRNFWDFR